MLALRVMVFLAFTVVTSCSLITTPAQILPELALLAPYQGPSSELLKQRLSFNKVGVKRQFLVVTRLTADDTKLVALLPTGQQLMSLSYDGEEFSHQSQIQSDIPAREILAILQFCLWPETVLNQYYDATQGWTMSLNPHQRVLYWQQQPWLKVVYLSDKIEIVNLMNQYQVTIETYAKEELL